MRKQILHSGVSSSEILEKGAVQNVREIPYWINISEQTGQFQLGERDFMFFLYAVEQLEVPAYFHYYHSQHSLTRATRPERVPQRRYSGLLNIRVIVGHEEDVRIVAWRLAGKIKGRVHRRKRRTERAFIDKLPVFRDPGCAAGEGDERSAVHKA
jgi:hypothetical protein